VFPCTDPRSLDELGTELLVETILAAPTNANNSKRMHNGIITGNALWLTLRRAGLRLLNASGIGFTSRDFVRDLSIIISLVGCAQ